MKLNMLSWEVISAASLFLGLSSALPLHFGAAAGVPDPGSLPLLLGLALLAASVSLIVGCACCQRLHNKNRNVPAIQGFNNATYDPTPAGELTLFPPLGSGPGGRPQFEPLPDLSCVTRAGLAMHPRPAIYNLSVSRGFSAKDWFDDPHRNFPRQQLKYQQELGSGWFGQALLGEARNLTAEQKTDVVVKVLRAGATLPEQMYFLHEMSMLRDANHPHVLRLLGRCLEADPYLLILERCGVGDCKEYLQSRSPVERQTLLDTMSLNKMATDAAAGISHLHDIHYTHSDLAARSCRVMENCTLKIGDYGCNIDKYREDYYIAGEVALPVRWCAPEILECTSSTIETKQVTKSSNVWSLGVLLWELLTFAALPYAPLSDDDVIQHVVMDRNVQLSRPKLSTGSPHTDRMYQVMQLCWLPASQRPTVHRIHALLSQLTAPPKDDFEERWEALRPRGRADGGSGSATPEPSQPSQPASLDSELHDALRSLDRMLAAEETVSEVNDLSVDATDPGGESGESSAEGESGRLSEKMREQSRSVQDFLTLTAPLDSLELSSETAGSDVFCGEEGAAIAAPPPAKVSTADSPQTGIGGAAGEVRPTVEDTDLTGEETTACELNAGDLRVRESAPMVTEAPLVGGRVTGYVARDTCTGGGGEGVGTKVVTHSVPELNVVEATPPRPVDNTDDSEMSSPQEPPTINPRAFMFVMNESADSSCEVTNHSRFCDSNANFTDASSEPYFTADNTLNISAVDNPSAEQLTSTPREQRSPAFSDYIDSTFQTALEDNTSHSTQSEVNDNTLMGSRQSIPIYSALRQNEFEDLNYGLDEEGADEPGCDVALLKKSDDDDDDDAVNSEIKRAVDSSRGCAGDVPEVPDAPLPSKPDWPSLSPTPGEAGSPPRSPSLSSTFGHSTCDELAELQDEDEVRSLGSRAEIVPSKLWGSAEGWGSPQAPNPERKLSADVITIIEMPPGEADSSETIVLPGDMVEPSDVSEARVADNSAEGREEDREDPSKEESIPLLNTTSGDASLPEGTQVVEGMDVDGVDVEETHCCGGDGCNTPEPTTPRIFTLGSSDQDLILADMNSNNEKASHDLSRKTQRLEQAPASQPEVTEHQLEAPTRSNQLEVTERPNERKHEPSLFDFAISEMKQPQHECSIGEKSSDEDAMLVDFFPDVENPTLVQEAISSNETPAAAWGQKLVEQMAAKCLQDPEDPWSSGPASTESQDLQSKANQPSELCEISTASSSTASNPFPPPDNPITSPTSTEDDLNSLEGSGGFELTNPDLPLPLTSADPSRKYMMASEAAEGVVEEQEGGVVGLDDGEFWKSLRQAAEQTAKLVEEAQKDSPERKRGEDGRNEQEGRQMKEAEEDDSSATTKDEKMETTPSRSENYRTMFLLDGDNDDDVLDSMDSYLGRDRLDSGGFDSLSGLGLSDSLSNETPSETPVSLPNDTTRSSALDAVRLELSRTLPELSDSAEPDSDAEPPAGFCPPSVPALATIREEEELSGDEEEEGERRDQVPDSWREDAFMEVEIRPVSRSADPAQLQTSAADSGPESDISTCHVTSSAGDFPLVTSCDVDMAPLGGDDVADKSTSVEDLEDALRGFVNCDRGHRGLEAELKRHPGVGRDSDDNMITCEVIRGDFDHRGLRSFDVESKSDDIQNDVDMQNVDDITGTDPNMGVNNNRFQGTSDLKADVNLTNIACETVCGEKSSESSSTRLGRDLLDNDAISVAMTTNTSNQGASDVSDVEPDLVSDVADVINVSVTGKVTRDSIDDDDVMSSLRVGDSDAKDGHQNRVDGISAHDDVSTAKASSKYLPEDLNSETNLPSLEENKVTTQQSEDTPQESGTRSHQTENIDANVTEDPTNIAASASVKTFANEAPACVADLDSVFRTLRRSVSTATTATSVATATSAAIATATVDQPASISDATLVLEDLDSPIVQKKAASNVKSKVGFVSHSRDDPTPRSEQYSRMKDEDYSTLESRSDSSSHDRVIPAPESQNSAQKSHAYPRLRNIPNYTLSPTPTHDSATRDSMPHDSDSDSGSDVLVVDTESLEARLLEGGRPKSHVAFVTSQQQSERAEEREERALEARFDLSNSQEVRGDQLMGRTSLQTGDSDYEGDFESLPADINPVPVTGGLPSGSSSTHPGGVPPGPEAGGLTRSLASYNLAEGAVKGWTEPPASWEYPTTTDLAEGDTSSLQQHQSLPVQPQYDVLSQPLSKLERRRSFPTAASSTTLTEEELRIDASIPTYDDVISFGDTGASLSSSEGDGEERVGEREGVNGRSGESEGEDGVQQEDDFVSMEKRGEPRQSERVNPETEVVEEGSGQVKQPEQTNSRAKDDEDSSSQPNSTSTSQIPDNSSTSERSTTEPTAIHNPTVVSSAPPIERSTTEPTAIHNPTVVSSAPPIDSVLHYATEARLEEAEAEAVQEDLSVEEDVEDDVYDDGDTKMLGDQNGLEESGRKGKSVEEKGSEGLVRREGRLSPDEELEPGRHNPSSGATVPSSLGSEGLFNQYPSENSDANSRNPEIDDLTLNIDGVPSGKTSYPHTTTGLTPTESTSPSHSTTLSDNPSFLDSDSENSDDDELSSITAAARQRRIQELNSVLSQGMDKHERLRQVNQEWGVPHTQEEEDGGGEDGEDGERYTPDWEEDDGSSSTSGEFVWQDGSGLLGAAAAIVDSPPSDDSESGEEEFTPSVWRRDKQPNHGVLRSPERRSELRKSVSFKRQKHHRIYEYPLASPSPDAACGTSPEMAAPSPSTRPWSFVAPSTVSHYTDWDLDDEEIEDISITELAESPEHQTPRLTAASHYFLSTAGTGDDENDGEFFIRADCDGDGEGYSGSSFSPGAMFPQAEALWAGFGDEGGSGGVWEAIDGVREGEGGEQVVKDLEGESCSGCELSDDHKAQTELCSREAESSRTEISGPRTFDLWQSQPNKDSSNPESILNPNSHEKALWRLGPEADSSNLDPLLRDSSVQDKNVWRREPEMNEATKEEEARSVALWAVPSSSGRSEDHAEMTDQEPMVESGGKTNDVAPQNGEVFRSDSREMILITSSHEESRVLSDDVESLNGKKSVAADENSVDVTSLRKEVTKLNNQELNVSALGSGENEEVTTHLNEGDDVISNSDTTDMAVSEFPDQSPAQGQFGNVISDQSSSHTPALIDNYSEIVSCKPQADGEMTTEVSSKVVEASEAGFPAETVSSSQEAALPTVHVQLEPDNHHHEATTGDGVVIGAIPDISIKVNDSGGGKERDVTIDSDAPKVTNSVVIFDPLTSEIPSTHTTGSLKSPLDSQSHVDSSNTNITSPSSPSTTELDNDISTSTNDSAATYISKTASDDSAVYNLAVSDGGAERRPARESLFLDLNISSGNAKDVPTVDSGYTGSTSCDDRSVAAFVAMDGGSEGQG